MQNTTTRKKRAQKTTKATNTPLPLTRGEVLEKVSEAINFIHKKITTGRISKNDEKRVNLTKSLAYLANTYFSGLKDNELDNLSARLNEIERELKTGRTP